MMHARTPFMAATTFYGPAPLYGQGGVVLAAMFNHAGVAKLSQKDAPMSAAEGAYVLAAVRRRWHAAVVSHWRARSHVCQIYGLQNDPQVKSAAPSFLSLLDMHLRTASHGLCIEAIDGRSINTWFDWDGAGTLRIGLSRYHDASGRPLEACLADPAFIASVAEASPARQVGGHYQMAYGGYGVLNRTECQTPAPIRRYDPQATRVRSVTDLVYRRRLAR